MPALAESRDDLGRRQDLHVPPARTPSTATATRSSPLTSSTAGGGSSTRAPRPRTATSWARSTEPATCSASTAKKLPPRRARSTRCSTSSASRRRTTRRSSSPSPRRRRTSSLSPRCGSTVPIQEKWITSEGATEAGNYVSSGPFMLESWDHNEQIVLKPNPNWYGQKPTLTEIRMPIFAELAEAQRAYEADEVDIRLSDPGSRTSSGSRTIPTFADQYSDDPARSGSRYYNFNNGVDPDGQGQARALPGRKDLPDGQQELPDRPDPGDRQAVVHRHDLLADRRGRQQLRHAGLPGLRRDDQPVSVRPRRRQGRAWTRPSPELGYAECRGDRRPLEVRLQYRRRPRAARRLPGRGLATRPSASSPSQIGIEFPTSSRQRTAGEYDIARNGVGRRLPARQQPARRPVHLRWRQQRQPVLQPGVRRAPQAGGRRRPTRRSRSDLYKQAQQDPGRRCRGAFRSCFRTFATWS